MAIDRAAAKTALEEYAGLDDADAEALLSAVVVAAEREALELLAGDAPVPSSLADARALRLPASRRGGPRRLAVRRALGGQNDEGIVRIARRRRRRRKQAHDLVRRADGPERAWSRAERRSSGGEVELGRRRERDRRLRLRNRPRRGQHRPDNRLDLHRRDRCARRDLLLLRPRIRRRRRERKPLGCRDCLAARTTTTSATSA